MPHSPIHARKKRKSSASLCLHIDLRVGSLPSDLLHPCLVLPRLYPEIFATAFGQVFGNTMRECELYGVKIMAHPQGKICDNDIEPPTGGDGVRGECVS